MLFQSPDLRIDLDASHNATLWLDVREQRYNIFTPAVLDQFEQAFQTLAAASGIESLVIRSDKASGFLAGADLHAFTQIRSVAEAEALSARGQKLFNQLAELPIRTYALIHGPCLGGGLELALACDYRLAVDQPDTLLGLPEVELGLLPAWGGCQRLPRVVGLEQALKMILAARKLNAGESQKVGLVDLIAPPSQVSTMLAEALTWGVSQPVGRHKRARQQHAARTWRQRLLERNPLGRRILFQGARRLLRRKVPDDLPAPGEALQAIALGVSRGLEAGLAAERAAAGRLSQSPACRNLIGLFFLREKYRKVPAALKTMSAPPIRRVGIVGAGAMGAGIAQLALLRGCQVVVQEVNDAALQAGVQRIEDLFKKAVERGITSGSDAHQRLADMGRTTSWQGFDQVDLVVEAVIEDLELKRRVFQEAEQRTRPDAILATNTSSLLVKDIQAGLANPARVGAVHFFNPVHKMPLVEVAFTRQTEERVVASLAAWTVALGKMPVVVKDSPGFLVNRVLVPYFYEAMRVLLEGTPPDKVDRAIRKFGMPMGPFELLDQIGLDVAAHITRTLQPYFGDRYLGEPIFDRFVQAGALGHKASQGFYLYDRQKPRVNPALDDLLGRLKGDVIYRLVRLDREECQERLILPMVNEAAACLGEGIVTEPEAVDVALIFGTGWAPHRGGPLRYADQRGLADAVRILENLSREYGPRFEPCPELRRRVTSAEAFYGDAERSLDGRLSV